MRSITHGDQDTANAASEMGRRIHPFLDSLADMQDTAIDQNVED